jgi:hypothetical protein
MADVPNWKRRRLAARALRIQARRAPSSPPINAFGATLVPKALTFIEAYDKAAMHETAWKREMNEGRGAIAKLLVQMRSWLPVIHGDVPTLNTSTFGDNPEVPDDVIADGERLLKEATDAKTPLGDPLPYLTELQTSFGADLEKARTEWKEAEASDSSYQLLLATVRATGDAFNSELTRFRRTLAAVAGRQDKDYQKLRAERVTHPDEDDDGGGEAPKKEAAKVTAAGTCTAEAPKKEAAKVTAAGTGTAEAPKKEAAEGAATQPQKAPLVGTGATTEPPKEPSTSATEAPKEPLTTTAEASKDLQKPAASPSA